jgi:hypothetical protein
MTKEARALPNQHLIEMVLRWNQTGTPFGTVSEPNASELETA